LIAAPVRWSVREALAGEREILRWFVGARLVTFAFFAALYEIGPIGLLGPARYRAPLALLGAWDGTWYLHVARHGYLLVPGHQSDPAFFPLFPILVRGLHLCGLPYLPAAALIANGAFAVDVVAFHRLGRRLLPDEIARRGAVFLAITPIGFVFSMAYPESVLLGLIVLSVLAALDGRWLGAATLAGLAVLTRPEGLFVSIPLAAIAWRGRRALDSGTRGRALAAILAAPVALLAFPLYLQWSIGDALAWSKAEESWGRSFRLDGPIRAVEHVPKLLEAHPLLARDLVLFAVYAALLLAAFRRTATPRSWILAGGLILVLPLFSGTFESEGRFGLLALPVYWGAASFALSPRAERLTRTSCLVLLAAAVLTIPYVWP